MADYSTMKGPELEEILIKRGFKQVRKMGKAQKLELVMSGATPTSVVSLDAPVTPTNLDDTPVPELIKIIKRKAPDMKGYTKKPKSELVAIIEGLGTSLDTKLKPKPKRPVVKRPVITTKVETRGAAEEAVAPGEAAERAKAKQEKEAKEKPPPKRFMKISNLQIPETERDKEIMDELKKKRDERRKVPISTSSLTSSATFSLFEKKNKAELLEEAKKLGLKGMGPKKKEEVLSAVVNETDRRKGAAEESPKPEKPKPERPKIPKPPKPKPKIVSSAILKEEAKKAEEAEEEIEYDEDGAPVNKYPGESKGAVDMEWQNMTPFPKPSLQTFEKISGFTVEESFDRILIIMEVLFFLKRSKKTFIMDWGEGKKEVNTNGIYNLLDKYYNELRILFGEATKFWKITQQEKNKMRAKAEGLTDTDKKRYDVIKDFIEPEMGLEFQEFGDEIEYFLRVINEKEQEEEGYYTKETGGYESAEGYVGTFLQMFLEDENIEEYVIEAKRLERLEEQKEEDDEEALRARDIVQPLELEEGQDWKTLSLPNKVRYFLSMVDYEPRSMGQIERQSLAKMDRMIERVRYDYGEDEEMPEHYFPAWNSPENISFGTNIFEEYNWREADQVPKDIEGVPKKPGRFFKGVFTDDGIEYIVNYFGMFGVKDVIETEIKSNKLLNEWRKLSWVKYKRFNFWQRPIVLEMTKGPMMIVPVYNIYDIRQSTIGVRPIQGYFEFSGLGGYRKLKPSSFESIQDELEASYYERIEQSDEEDEEDDTDDEEERRKLPKAPWDLVKDFMFELPSDLIDIIEDDDSVSIEKIADIYHYINQFKMLYRAYEKNYDSDRFYALMSPAGDDRVHKVKFREAVKEVKNTLERFLKKIDKKFNFLHNDEFINGPVQDAIQNVKRGETGAIFREVAGAEGPFFWEVDNVELRRERERRSSGYMTKANKDWLDENPDEDKDFGEVGYWFEPPEWFEKWGFIVKLADEKFGEDTNAIYTPVDYMSKQTTSNIQIKKEEEYWDQLTIKRKEDYKQYVKNVVEKRKIKELEKEMASLSVRSLPPNEPEMLPDATPPVEKEEVVEVVITPPNIYNQMGVLLPAGILPPDEDARVMPMPSIHAGDAIPSTNKGLMELDGDWFIDTYRLVTVEDEEIREPNESGIVWLFAEILNRNDPTETNFIAACEDDIESQITIDKKDRFTIVEDEVFDINTGDKIGIVERPDDDEMGFIEFTSLTDMKPKKEPKKKPKKKPADDDDSDDDDSVEETKLKPFKYEGEPYFKDKQGVVYMIDKDGEYDAIGTLNDDKYSIHFY